MYARLLARPCTASFAALLNAAREELATACDIAMPGMHQGESSPSHALLSAAASLEVEELIVKGHNEQACLFGCMPPILESLHVSSAYSLNYLNRLFVLAVGDEDSAGCEEVSGSVWMW